MVIIRYIMKSNGNGSFFSLFAIIFVHIFKAAFVYYVGKDCFNDEPMLQGPQKLHLILILLTVMNS